MAGEDRWIQDALDAWLSDEPGTGPAEDDAWRAKTGFFRSEWRGGGAPATSPATSPAAAPPVTPAGAAGPASDAPAERYEEDRAGLAAAMASFRRQLTYAFPDVNVMGMGDIAAAASWITDMEKHLLERKPAAMLHKQHGRAAYGGEIDEALAELARSKQTYSLRRTRIEQSRKNEIARINAEKAAFEDHNRRLREQMWRKSQDEIRAMEEDSRRRRDEDNDRIHRQRIRDIRGETTIRIELDPDY